MCLNWILGLGIGKVVCPKLDTRPRHRKGSVPKLDTRPRIEGFNPILSP